MAFTAAKMEFVVFYTEHGARTVLRDVGIQSPYHTSQEPRRLRIHIHPPRKLWVALIVTLRKITCALDASPNSQCVDKQLLLRANLEVSCLPAITVLFWFWLLQKAS